MVGLKTKREQARNERTLQELIKTVPGNDRCADCGARNPGWASWSLGIFLCMRCASIHRKLGTHVSKVKSLSMDHWSTEEVEHMKTHGNTIVNRIYNPRNVKPNLPLDVEEVDTAIERFIRRKYEERSLGDGRPKPPPKDDEEPFRSSSDSPPRLPVKKGRLFHFGLRATSSAYPLSKQDKKNLPIEPTMENAFHVSPTTLPPNKQSQVFGATIAEADSVFEAKLVTLKEMGFPDNNRNAKVLKGLNGNLERTIESLCRLGEGSNPNSKNPTPVGSARNTPQTATFPDSVKSPTLKPPAKSTNPFDNLDPPASFGLSFAQPQQQSSNSLPVSPTNASNPFGLPPDPQTATQGLEQSFQGLQVSRQLFPHSTGGYPSQAQQPPQMPFSQSMTPPITSNNFNPFFQNTQTPQPAPPDNPFINHLQQPSSVVNPTNPFLSQSALLGQPTQSPQASDQPQQGLQSLSNNIPFQTTQRPSPMQNNINPFGLPPSNGPLPTPLPHQSPIQQTPSIPQQYQQQSSLLMPFQPKPQPQNPGQFQSPSQSLPQFHQQSPQPLFPQPTGRIDKSSILALYNYPQLAPTKLPTIQDIPTSPNEQPPPQPQAGNINPNPNPQNTNSTSPAASPVSAAKPTAFGAPAVLQGQGKRSVTMPAVAMSRNPFLNSLSGVGAGPPGLSPVGAGMNGTASASASAAGVGMLPSRHSSRESADVSSLGLQSGRHSPDAFASLSARFS